MPSQNKRAHENLQGYVEPKGRYSHITKVYEIQKRASKFQELAVDQESLSAEDLDQQQQSAD